MLVEGVVFEADDNSEIGGRPRSYMLTKEGYLLDKGYHCSVVQQYYIPTILFLSIESEWLFMVCHVTYNVKVHSCASDGAFRMVRTGEKSSQKRLLS